MHIFIDESGNFVFAKERKSKVSSITALIIPDKYIRIISQKFLLLRTSWGYDDEVKGSKLTEKQIDDVITLLRSYDVLVEIVWFDIGHHSIEIIEKFKNIQADKLIENLTDKHHSDLIKQMHECRENLLKLPNQLFIQSIVQYNLIQKILTTAPTYYSQCLPDELENFAWYIDSKNKEVKTNFEKLWSTLLMPALQNNYFIMLEGGDYSYFEKYIIPYDKIPDSRRSLKANKSADGVDLIKLIKENLYFEDSSSQIGLQLVDIVSSTFGRAMNGTLNINGWGSLGSLMVHVPPALVLNTDTNINTQLMQKRHDKVIERLRKTKKSIQMQ